MRNTFSLLGVLLSLLAFGQSNCTFTIEGWVKDEHHNDILYGATVYIPALQRGVQVDSTGHFRLSNICPGTYVMVASHIGCQPERKTIEVGHSDLVLTFYLEHHTELLEEVQLQIEANSLQLSTAKQAQNRTQLSALELPELRMQSMGNSVQKPLINGLGGMRVETLQDGLSLQDQQWGSDHGLSLLLFPDDRVEVKQSGGLAGSVEIQSPDPSTLSNYVFLQGQSNGRGGAVGTQLALLQGPRFSSALRAQFHRLGDLHTADYALDNTAQQIAQLESHSTWLTEKREVRLRLRYFEHQLGILRASHVGSVSDLERALRAEEPLIQRGFSYSINEPRQWVQHGSVHLDYREYFRENTYLELQYGYQLNHRREYENSRGNRNSIPAFNLLFQDHQVQLAYHFGGIALGAQSQFGVQSNLPDRRFEAVIPNFNRWLYGAFVEGEHRISERGLLSWDARLNTQRYIAQFYEADNLQSRPFNFVQSSAHLEYTRASATWLQWDILQRMGLRWQERAPYFHELTIDGVHHGTASYELGNADLNKEQLMGAHYELLMKQSAHQFRLGLFGHYIRNFIYQSAGNPVLTIRGAFPLFQYEQVDAAFAGGQLQYRWLWNRYWSLQSQVRYQFAEPLNERSALPLIPPLEFSQSIQFAKWPSSIGEWSLSLQHQYVAQQWHYDPEVELASPPKGYSLWNAEVQWTPRNTKQWNVSLNLLNLTNTAYRNYLDQFRYFADAPGFNAQIFVQYEF